ncbi:hypothetical protein ACSQ67_026121 [Phaseolus vulgaris]
MIETGVVKVLSHATEPESNWKLADTIFAYFTVFTPIFMGLYVLVRIWSVAPSTIKGLEFGGLNLLDSIGEFVFFVVFVLQGSNLAFVDSSGLSDPYVVFTCNGKTRTSSIKFQKSNPIWNGNTDLRLNQPRYATLPNIMKAKSKPIQKFTPEELNVEIISDLEIVEVTEPPKRKAGVIVSSVDELIHKLKNEANVI